MNILTIRSVIRKPLTMFVTTAVIAMKQQQLPPTINLEKPDPDCDLDYIPLAGRKATIEHAVCNCIAFGSKNSALVLRKVD